MNQVDRDWLVVRYKINEHSRFKRNLLAQNFEFYIPRIFTNTQNSSTKKIEVLEEALFPGYGFVRMAQTNLHALKYTLGLINILRFGDQYAIATNLIINQLKDLEASSKIQPFTPKQIIRGDIVTVNAGPFKGYIAKILATPAKHRANILITFLGSQRTLTLSVDKLQKN
ncbi:hypothetical protein OAD36_04675 [Gammaproteobacteria bacterium]|nr:hypothetical protein [Gammaproteobacteria bacterium]